DLGGGLSGGLFQHFVQVVDVNSQAFREVARGPQLQHLRGILDGKLPLEELDKQAEYACRGVEACAARFHRLEFLPVVDEFKHIRAQQVVFEGIPRIDLSMHLTENQFNLIKLFKRYLKYKVALRQEDRKLFQFEASFGLGHEFGSEHTEMSFLVSVDRHIPVGDPRRSKKDGMVLDVEDLVGVLDPVSSLDQANLIVRSAVIGHLDLLLSAAEYLADVKDVKMPDLPGTLVFEKMVDFGGECAENVGVEFLYRCRRHGIAKFKVREFIRNNRGCS